MIMRTNFPQWYSDDEFGSVRDALECYEGLIDSLISFGEQINMRLAFCIPLSGHSTARSSATPSVFVVVGKGKDGKVTCFRPDGRVTAIYEDGKWNFVGAGWVEVRNIPMFQTTTNVKVPLDPLIMRAGPHTVYVSNYIGKYFDGVVFTDFDFKMHLENVKTARKLNKEFESSFIMTLRSWFKKPNLKVHVIVDDKVVTLVKSYEELEKAVFKK